ncbi:MAG: HINT domain-containing protein, partial [Abditibacteriales bacterium]|nr:HINT domain-containing protein [Abditibacteriales bacterium]
YVYAANNPVSGFDYQGQWWETALDIAGLIWDIKEAIEDPGWDDILWIGGDIISLILPTPTPSMIRHGEDVVKWIDDVWQHGDNFFNGVQKLVDDACFVAGTLVQTKEGLKPIEEVQAGEWVVSRDERTGAVSYQRVKRTFERGSAEIVTVQAGKETIKTTPEHPFWVEGKGWVAAKALARGARLVTADEKVIVVTEVQVEAVRGPPVIVYNFEVENTHTYFVGKQGVWVHNACRPLDLYRGVEPEELKTVLNTGRFPVDIPGGRMDDTLWLTTNPSNDSQYGTVVKVPVDPDGLADMINKGEAFYDALGWMDQVRIPKPNIEKFNDIIIGPITKYDPWEHYR